MIKTVNLRNVVDAAEELGLQDIPWSWIKCIRRGWIIRRFSGPCGGNWAWMKPDSSGVMNLFGCVCHCRLK